MPHNDNGSRASSRADNQQPVSQSIAESSQLSKQIFAIGPLASSVVMIGRYSARQQIAAAQSFEDVEAILHGYSSFVRRVGGAS